MTGIRSSSRASTAAAHPSLIDTRHVTGELFGFVNIPMAVWIDETGTIVRNAESASIERSPLRDMEVPDGIPERMRTMLTEVKAIPDEVVARSQPRDGATARATACFELGRHLRAAPGGEAGEVYGTSWIDDVLAGGGGAHYTLEPDL